jgi:hypothetical protein
MDPIDRVVRKVSSDDFFTSGMFKPIDLPATASAEELAGKLFVPPIKILTNREVRIADDPYRAVMVETSDGRKVVLFRYDEKRNRDSKLKGWWSRVYDD